MKILNRNTSVNYDGVEAKEFKWEINAKSFDLVIRNIYTDPILSIIRELSCNALDAHVEAGVADRPFDIKLPTLLDLKFSIRDYGPGLSKDKFENVYVVINKSDKTNSNDAVGCYGIGSKTPFAYADNYIVRSYHQGMLYTYAMFFNKSGNPSYSLLSEEATTEPNGLEIEIAVDKNDISKFKTTAENVFTYFKVKPKTNVPISVKDVEYLFENDNWGIRPVNSYNYGLGNGLNVIMGPIKYLCDINSIPYKHQQLLSYCDIYLPIGACDVDAGRERVLPNKKFLYEIDKVIKLIEKYDFTASYQHIVDQMPSLFQASCTDITRQVPHILHQYVHTTQWRGKDLVKFPIDISSLTDVEYYYTYNKVYSKTRDRCKRIQNPNIYNTLGKFFEDDLPRGSITRIGENYPHESKHVFVFKNQKAKDELLTKLGLEDDSIFIKVSSLPKKIYTRKVTRVTQNLCLSYNKTGVSYTEVDYKTQKNVYYVESHNKSVYVRGKEFSRETFKSLIYHAFAFLGLPKKNVILIRRSELDKVTNNPNYTKLDDILVDATQKLFDNLTTIARPNTNLSSEVLELINKKILPKVKNKSYFDSFNKVKKAYLQSLLDYNKSTKYSVLFHTFIDRDKIFSKKKEKQYTYSVDPLMSAALEAATYDPKVIPYIIKYLNGEKP